SSHTFDAAHAVVVADESYSGWQPATEDRRTLRWVAPLAALVVFGGVVGVLHHELKQLHIRSVFEHLHAIPRGNILAALGFTAASYLLLSSYDALALRYRQRAIVYSRILFTSFITYSFG